MIPVTRHVLLATSVAFISAGMVFADPPKLTDDRAGILSAVERGLAVVEKAGRNYPTHRKCFACHHQTLPLLAIGEARAAGLKTEEALPVALADFTARSFRDKIDDLRAGENIGGRGLTVGYGLWTLRLVDTKPDDLTSAMITYLLKTQAQDGHWDLHAIRPPAEESLVMSTVLAAGGIRQFAGQEQRENAATALEKARAWLAAAKLASHEDRVARLWGVKLLGGKDEELEPPREALLATQREDGGWGQMADMESDAYATGTALYVLLDTGTPAADQEVQRGVQFLLKTQLDDGSWHVKTRAKPVQVFFDNGDPHGKDQFISIPATGWSVAALARAMRESKIEK
jgi:N-acyl-D-amino-acid deacylase